MSMEIIKGKSILNKVAIGPILYHRKTESQVKRRTVENTGEEVSRYEAAVACAKEELRTLHRKACEEVGETGAAVFEVHMMMLEDADYRDSVLNIIRNQKTNAEYAAAVTGDNFYRLFADMDDEYFRAQAADVKDITDRLIKILSGNAVESGFLTRPVILMAEDLAPSETVQLEKNMLLGFITEQRLLGIQQNLLGGTLLHDIAAVHKDHSIGHLSGEAHLVGDDHHGHAVGCQLLHHR